MENGGQHKIRGALFSFEFPFLFASAVNIYNTVRYAQGPRGGAASSVGVQTGQREDQQRAEGGGEIPMRVQEKSPFFAASLRHSGKCVIKLDSGAGCYEAQPKKEAHLPLLVVERDEVSVRT